MPTINLYLKDELYKRFIDINKDKRAELRQKVRQLIEQELSQND